MEHIIILVQSIMKDNGLKMKGVDGEGCITLMVLYMKANGLVIKQMERV